MTTGFIRLCVCGKKGVLIYFSFSQSTKITQFSLFRLYSFDLSSAMVSIEWAVCYLPLEFLIENSINESTLTTNADIQRPVRARVREHVMRHFSSTRFNSGINCWDVCSFGLQCLPYGQMTSQMIHSKNFVLLNLLWLPTGRQEI